MSHLREDEQEWQRLADAATAGAWTSKKKPDQHPAMKDVSFIPEIWYELHGAEHDGIYAASDADFIATARTAVPELLARLDALRAMLCRYFDCEVAFLDGMHQGGQTLAAGYYDEMQATQEEIKQLVGWKYRPAASGRTETGAGGEAGEKEGR